MDKPNFKKICLMYMQQLTNFPYIEKDFDALTDYALLCKVVEYLNEVIKNNNTQNETVTNLYNAFIELKNYVDNLDFQDEVNKKLDEMASDGTLANLINEEIFSELNDKVNHNTNTLNNLQKESQLLIPYLNDVGDCTIVKIDNKVIIIDLGQNHPQELINFLINNNIEKIDYVIITHYHQDHYCGMGNLNGEIEGFKEIIRNSNLDFSNCEFILPFTNNGTIWDNFVGSSFYYSVAETNIKNYLNQLNLSYHEAQTNETIVFSETNYLKIINADLITYSNYYNETLDYEIDGVIVPCTNYNNFSLITEINFDTTKYLNTSDIDRKAEYINANNISYADIYKIEHHGNNQFTNKIWRNKVKSYFSYITGGSSLVTSWYRDTDDENVNMVSFQRAINSNMYWINNLKNNVIISIINNKIKVYSNNGESFNTINFNNILSALNSVSFFPELGIASSIRNGSDLNELPTGTLRSESASVTNTLINKPTNLDSGFRIFTGRITNDNSILQIIIQNYTNNIYYRTKTNNTWTPWVMIPILGNKQFDIKENDDLNNITNPGFYACGTTALAQTLTNCPISEPFKLENDTLNNNSNVKQILITNTAKMYLRVRAGGNWTSWKQLSN